MGESEPVIIDLGAGTDPDRRATITADIARIPGLDMQFDLDSQPWPIKNGTVDAITASHVFEHLVNVEEALEEASRVLKPGGWLELDVPLGRPNKTDPTHENMWTWTTPEFFAKNGTRDYYYDLPFTIKNRSMTVWLEGPLSKLSPLYRMFINLYSPGDWVSGTPYMAGTLTIRFQRE